MLFEIVMRIMPVGMRSLVVSAALALLAGGCQTKRQALIGTGAGIGMFALGMLSARALVNEDDPPRPVVYTTIGLLYGGAGIAGASLVSLLYYELKAPKEVTPAAPLPTPEELASRERTERREQAWTLAKRSTAAARNGTCEPATRHASAVRVLDLDFYTRVFLRDPAIARCLGLVPR